MPLNFNKKTKVPSYSKNWFTRPDGSHGPMKRKTLNNIEIMPGSLLKHKSGKDDFKFSRALAHE
jgi:hypothetical protein